MNNVLYENFHKSSKFQKYIINSNNFTYKNLISCMNKFLPISGHVLDVGCGTGTMSLYLSKNNFEITGLDISQKAVSIANNNKKKFKIKNIRFKNISVEKYKDNKKYDLIICFDLLEHVENDNATLNKIFNLLKSKSTLFVSVPSLNAPLFKLGLLNNFDKEVGHIRRYSEKSIIKILRNNGFKIIKVCKKEGILRNILFTNKLFGNLIKIIRLPILNEIFNFIDDLTIKLFGESQLIIITKKK